MAEGVEDAGESEGRAVMARIGPAQAGDTQPERAQTSSGSHRTLWIWTPSLLETLDGGNRTDRQAAADQVTVRHLRDRIFRATNSG